MTEASARALPWLAATGGAALLLAVALAVALVPLEPGVLRLQLAWAPRTFGAIVHLWPPEDLARYRAWLPADAALAACEAAFGALLALRGRLFDGAPRGARRALAAVALAAGAAHAGQVGLHAWLTEAPRFGVAPLYAVAAGAASLKWLLLLGYVLAVLAALARRPA